ncbi:hypothetical protein HDU76_000011 [Blyttiomyces sp. JEL0837]|nr:hypothetical protein HDU76_000011 [Blyttiomyces sp. JEL0837]
MFDDLLTGTFFPQDLIGKDFLGQLHLPISEVFVVSNRSACISITKSTLFKDEQYTQIITSCYNDAQNLPSWHMLLPRHPVEKVTGDLQIRYGYIGTVTEELRQMQQLSQPIRKGSFYATLVSNGEDLTDGTVFSSLRLITGKDVQECDADGLGLENATGFSSTWDGLALDHTNLMGMLCLEIVNADIRAPSNSTPTCDPFVLIRFAKKTFRTRILRNTTKPAWNESAFIHIYKSDYESQNALNLSLINFEKSHLFGSVDLSVVDLVKACPKTVTVENKVTQFLTTGIPLKISETGAKVLTTEKATQLNLKVSFIHFEDLRRNFFISLMKNFDSNSDNVINRVEFTTMLDCMGATISDDSISMMFLHPETNEPVEEMPFTQAIKTLEDKLMKSLSLKNESTSPISPQQKGSGIFQRTLMNNERLINIAMCPKCFKKMGQGSLDIDIVSHVASGQLIEEKIPVYVRLGIRLLYQNAATTNPIESQAVKDLLRHICMTQGKKFTDPSSKDDIPHFISFHNIRVDEISLPLTSFQNLNEFLYRKLKPECRTMASPNPNIIVAPADSRVTCYRHISDATKFWIKGRNFTLSSLLHDKNLAHEFQGGSIAIFRLSTQDCHRFHSPIDGFLSNTTTIPGTYFTSNSMAIRSAVDIYTENVRTVTEIHWLSEVNNAGGGKTPTHRGKVIMVCVGAMLTGSIVHLVKGGNGVRKMDELGYFAFGGSTVILIFERGTVEFDNDLIQNSAQQLETLVKIGNQIGIHFTLSAPVTGQPRTRLQFS